MSEASQPNAAFYAFRKRDKRFVMTGAVVGYCILSLLLTAVFFALTWGAWAPLIGWWMQAMGAMQTGGEPSAPPMAALIAIAPLYALMVPLTLLLFAMLEAACLRWMVRGEAGGGLLGLKLDGDTLRVFLIYLSWFVFYIAVTIVIGLFYWLLFKLGDMGGVAQFVIVLIGALAPVGFGALLIWLSVLLAPAAALSVAQRRYAFFAAPKVARGARFWPLLTAFFIVIVGYAIISYVLSTILNIPLQFAIMPVLQEATAGADGAAMMRAIGEALLSPLVLGTLVVNVLASVILAYMFYVALFGVNARGVEAAVEAGDVERAPA